MCERVKAWNRGTNGYTFKTPLKPNHNIKLKDGIAAATERVTAHIFHFRSKYLIFSEVEMNKELPDIGRLSILSNVFLEGAMNKELPDIGRLCNGERKKCMQHMARPAANIASKTIAHMWPDGHSRLFTECANWVVLGADSHTALNLADWVERLWHFEHRFA